MSGPSGLNHPTADVKDSTQINSAEYVSDTTISCTPRLLNGPKFPVSNPKQLHASSAPPSSSANKPRFAQIRGDHQSPFITILPHDIHYLLATQHLEFDTLLALRQTCRTLYGILTPEIVRRVRSRLIKNSLESEAQQYRDYRAIYPRQRLSHLWDLLYAAFDFRLIERPAKELRCYGCLEVKPLWCFVERMSNRGTGLGAKSARDRMCKDCMQRYRDIEGQWWKENWVKKSDTVRKTSKGQRIRRWALEGQSLVNPEQEIGVCSACGSGTFELWWGCVACFEVEEQRRREEDLVVFDGFERKIVDVLETWRVRKEAKRRARQATRDRRTSKWWVPSFHVTWSGGLAERKAALVEWKESKEQQKSGCRPARSGTRDTTWRALDQNSLPKSRRAARCSSCWVPNCPRRMYILGLAYERPLPRERWCSGCQRDHESRQARREGRRWMMRSKEEREGGIFSDEWAGGLGWLYDES